MQRPALQRREAQPRLAGMVSTTIQKQTASKIHKSRSRAFKIRAENPKAHPTEADPFQRAPGHPQGLQASSLSWSLCPPGCHPLAQVTEGARGFTEYQLFAYKQAASPPKGPSYVHTTRVRVGVRMCGGPTAVSELLLRCPPPCILSPRDLPLSHFPSAGITQCQHIQLWKTMSSGDRTQVSVLA